MRNPNCKNCSLCKGPHTVCLWGSGPPDADIMIIGKAPKETDDIMGKVFTGKAGSILDTLLEEGNIDRNKIYITNIVKCKTPKDRPPTKNEKSACVDYLKNEIQTVNPKMIVVLGADALESLTGKDKIMKLAGSIINVQKESWNWEGKVFVTVHPSYLDKNMGYMPRAKKHFKDIGYYFRGEEPPKIPTNYVYLTDFSRIDKFFDQLERQSLIAYDTETNSLNFRMGKLLCFSFSWSIRSAVVLPLLGYRCKEIWTTDQFNHILSRLKQVFSKPSISWIAHNMSFDHKYVMAYGTKHNACKGMDIAGPLHDTMLIQQLLDENAMDLKGLKSLANVYTDMGTYDDPLDDFKANLKKEKSKLRTDAKKDIVSKIKMVKKAVDEDSEDIVAQEDLFTLQGELVSIEETSIDITYDEIPTDILWPYAAMDADATFRIFKQRYNELKRQSAIYVKYQDSTRKSLTLHRLYISLVMKLRRVLDEMEFIGTEMDIPYLNKLDITYSARIEELTSEINQLPEVSQVESILLKYSQDKAAIKWAELKSVKEYQKYLQLSNDGTWDTLKKAPRTPKFLNAVDYGNHYGKAVSFNMNSPMHLRVLLFDAFLVSKVGAKVTPTGALSTDHEVLEGNSDKPGVGILLENRKLVKLHNTYVKGSLSKLKESGHNRIHTNFNQHITVTGRLSSSQPNLQNIPREDKDIKRAFISSKPGWKIVQLDYAQAEFRMWCQLSKDDKMKNDIHNGLDIHYQTASDFWGIPVSQVTKKQRQAAKWVVFGLMYGRGAASVAQQVGITTAEAETIKKMFFARYPKAASWLIRTQKNTEQMLFVPGFFGRIRRLPYANSSDSGRRSDAARQAVNSPIQGGAADITGIALIRIRSKLKSLGFDKYANMLLTVHDSIILEVDENKIVPIVDLCVHSMVDKIPCMDVAMSVDVEIGDTWADVIPWDKYLAQKKGINV